MRLMCDMELNFDILSKQLNIDFREYFRDELCSYDEMEDDGLVTIDEDDLKVTPEGRLFIRNIAMRFDTYLRESKKAGRYSKTV